MEDITPGLLKRIQKAFASEFDKSKSISELYKKVKDGTATYKEANDFAIETGNILANAFKNNLSSDILPDGRMYYNIAQRIINLTLANNYDLITTVTNQVQQSLNKTANIGIKPITPELNQDRIDGIVNRISSAENFDDVAWLLGEPVVNFSQSIVDDSIRDNAEFHGKAGMTPKIVRKLSGGCCEWCRAVAGTYTYPNVPKDVYRRHQRCRCTVEYYPGDGKVQNVHSKQWINAEDYDKIEERKAIGLKEKNSRDLQKRKVVGLKVNGVTITELADHIFDRMDMREVEIEEIRDAIIKPLQIKPIKYDEANRPSFQIIGEKASLAVNPQTGTITTTWRTGSRLAKKLKRGGAE